ncbi:TAT-binding protein-like protein 7, AAA ATPase [Saxophila tyrrhenica]|uniref:TAT-binding protein-like protein 7, AAA ATPase n=1 Tax=Saxophila tyrrhenica TaxID=1690608 RepID=A0AAV9PEK9_9PEZI|nr:TAT-binding protein-like protein 7, AAA ATPase [Saxophila tyrrhenica]
MASKRKFDTFDPNKSDSDDLDYGATSSPAKSKPRARSQKPKSGARKPTKRRRETYNDSDIEADSNEVTEDDSFGQPSEEEEVALETNPRTGRSVRSVAKKPIKYEEQSEDDIEADDSDRRPQKATSKRAGRANSPVKKEKSSLVIKLKLPSQNMSGAGSRRSARAGSSRPTTKRGSTPQAQSAFATRRSSRISHSEEQPLVALTDSGRHEQVTRASSSTPPPARPTRASKGLKKPPSAIMEASQEGTDAGPAPVEGEEIVMSQPGLAVEAGVTEVERTSPGVEHAEAVGSEIQMEMYDEEGEEQVVQESMDDDEEDEAPVTKGRSLRQPRKASSPPTSQPAGTRRSMRAKKTGAEPSSDFEPEGEGDADVEDEEMSEDDLLKPPRGGRSSNDESTGGSRQPGRRSGRLGRKAASQRSQSRRLKSDEDNDELDPEEIADEAADLEEDNQRRRRERRRPARQADIAFEPNLRNRGARPDYRILRPELLAQMDEEDAPAAPMATPNRNRRTGGGGTYRSLFSTFGPFGGAGGPTPVFGGPDGQGATGGVDSDSSDDEQGGVKGGQGIGGTVGMTPTSAMPPRPYNALTSNKSDAIQGAGGGPPGLGKVSDKKALADADPLGVDTNVTFNGVGGLEDHINQLKEMVSLPLLYPEVFQQFHVTPPRGVLFHGPPGTGKTLLARALASSVSSGGKKVTFYMRKGADALSKWVGEAEKQLRLLFEEARKNQPSIIFFDEIDGLAPVRSSKQEQIHASIVATLLALMDGMDGRGQVIVIGATNRPDSVDPALRRPGRFDREFYFPLPDVKGRRSIIDIHTKGWEPALKPDFKDQLAELTRGYGGADLRALCTEAALNAVQGTYPQIYASDKKLQIDPSKIRVLAKDFMISVNKIVPSSDRSAASGASALKKDIEPLLRKPLQDVTDRVDKAIPRKRKATALEEAMYDDRDDETGFERENLLRQFESSRVFRPRLLIKGAQGMGQQYLGAALLSKLEGLHVQNFDMATLMKDSSRSPEAAIVQQFEEVKRHKPGVIYIPNVDIWYRTLGDAAIRTFTGLLRSIPPTEPILLLGVMEKPIDEDKRTKAMNAKTEASMLRDLFGYSLKNQYDLSRPDQPARDEYFNAVIDYIRKAPSEFPSQENRKRRKLDELPVVVAQEPTTREPSKAEQKAQKKKDHQTLNLLKLQIQPVMDQIKRMYRRFRAPTVEERDIAYLFDEQNPQVLTTNLNEEQMQQQQIFRPYEVDRDEKGVAGLREVASGKFFYNLEIVTVEKRLSNGYYKRPKDFLADIKRLAKDAKASGDQGRTLSANEMLANVEVDMAMLEQQQPALVAECEAVYERDLERERQRVAKARDAERRGEDVLTVVPNVPPQQASKTTTESSGPVVLGQQIPGVRPPLLPVTPSRLHPMSNPWSTTNGSHPSHQTNGSTVPSRPREDSEMLDSPDLQEQGSQHYQRSAASPEQHNTQSEFTQRSAHTRVAPGSQLDQYRNSASTTTSGQKTSDKSGRSSGPYSVNTQFSNGVRPDDHPRFSQLAEARGGSQLPDTQEQNFSSQHSHSQLSQQMPPPQSGQQHSQSQPHAPHGSSEGGKHSSINNLLNAPAPAPPTTTATTSAAAAGSASTNHLILDEPTLQSFHAELVQRSSGLSVEQLEQVNAGMMEMVWQGRGNWNRNAVLRMVVEAFNEVVADVEAVQAVLGPSQPEDVGGEGEEGEE